MGLLAQRSIRAAYYRGGTSRAIVFYEQDLPENLEARHKIFTAVLGAPDPNRRQLDGLGGGISSLSKICIVALSARADADIDFTFAQVGVEDGTVDYGSNCGNMTAAIGPFAVDHGMVDTNNMPEGSLVVVRIFNTNTNKVIHSKFAVQDGQAVVLGDLAIAGVAGSGASIELHFLNPAGAQTGKLLPTGNQRDIIDGIPTSMVDCANPTVFLRASSLGVDATLLPAALEADINLLSRLESIRRQAGVRMGLFETVENASAAIPKICLVSTGTKHHILSGEIVEESSVDLIVRVVSMARFHLASPITVACATAVAARLPESVVAECTRDDCIKEAPVRIGHPSGQIHVNPTWDKSGQIESAVVYRTARRLMEGQVFWKDNNKTGI
jgi:2-methylaconitate cis-trans-isomerase PrpF